MYKKVLATVLSLMVVVGTTSSAFAQDYYTTNNYYYPAHKQELTTGQKFKKALEYGAFGAGAGYVLSGNHHIGSNVLKGTAIGAAASLFTGR